MNISTDSLVIYHEDFEKNLTKEIIPKTIEIQYSLINHTEDTYTLFIDPDHFLVYETTDTEKYFNPTDSLLCRQILQPALILKDSIGRITNTGFAIEGSYFDKLPHLNQDIRHKMIVLKPFSEHKLIMKVSLPILNNNLEKGVFSAQYFMGISTYGLREGRFSILLNQNKALIIEALTTKIKKKLKRRNRRIYDGKIQSNEIPVVVK